jgi:hypothetical protein
MTISVVLWVVGLLVAYLIGVFANLTTPAIGNWFAGWSQTSLANRIAILERWLADLEASPLITEAEEGVLWGITSTKIAVLTACNIILIALYGGVRAFTNESLKIQILNILLVSLLTGNFVFALRLRYAHDFRYKHSPARKAGLRKAIDELKAIQRS